MQLYWILYCLKQRWVIDSIESQLGNHDKVIVIEIVIEITFFFSDLIVIVIVIEKIKKNDYLKTIIFFEISTKI